MDVSKLPTDNLYKFLAIFGLVLVVVSVGLIVFENSNLAQREVETIEETRSQEALRSGFELQLELLAKFDEASPGDGLLKEKIIELIEIVPETLVQAARTDTQSEANRYMDRNSYDNISRLYWLTGFGMLLSCIGFLLWYFKLQRHLDVVVRKEAQK